MTVEASCMKEVTTAEQIEKKENFQPQATDWKQQVGGSGRGLLHLLHQATGSRLLLFLLQFSMENQQPGPLVTALLGGALHLQHGVLE